MIKVFVFGGSGLVGSRFIKLNENNFEITSPDASTISILEKDQIIKVIEEVNPEVIINFAAFTDVQGAEGQKGDKEGLCYQLNAIGAKNVADSAKQLDKYLIHISTDYVFEGNKSDSAYTEEDSPNPKNWYGQTKYFGEENIKMSGANSTIIRISMPYVANYELKKDIARFFLGQLRDNKEIQAITNQRVTPTFVDDIANALQVIIEKKVSGIYHVTAKSWVSPFDFAHLIAKAFNLDASLIKPITLSEYNQGKLAPLLQYSWLNCDKFIHQFGEGIIHSVEEGIKLWQQEVIDPDLIGIDLR